jgi:hypothetical protein
MQGDRTPLAAQQAPLTTLADMIAAGELTCSAAQAARFLHVSKQPSSLPRAGASCPAARSAGNGGSPARSLPECGASAPREVRPHDGDP